MTTSITAGTLPKEYEDLRDTVADFARTVVAPVSAKHDEEHSFPYEVVAKMGEMGLFGLHGNHVAGHWAHDLRLTFARRAVNLGCLGFPQVPRSPFVGDP